MVNTFYICPSTMLRQAQQPAQGPCTQCPYTPRQKMYFKGGISRLAMHEKPEFTGRK